MAVSAATAVRGAGVTLPGRRGCGAPHSVPCGVSTPSNLCGAMWVWLEGGSLV